ncbi:MAG: VOC family protein [Thermoplasmata archaeon]
MEGKITVITIVVTDQTRSLEFFTEQAGFEKRTDITPPGGSRWVSVGLRGDGVEIALWPVSGAVDPSQKELSRNWSPAKAPPIVLKVVDCRRAYQEMSARGVEFILAPEDHPWGTVATFKDLDGNLFSMSQPPSAWPKA